MMGMHGEAWVNHAIQQADLLIAFGMRFDDRVTGNSATYAPHAKKIHIEIDPAEINKNVTRRCGAHRRSEQSSTRCSLSPANNIDGSVWLETINRMKGDAAVRDIQQLPDNGHLYAAHVINDSGAKPCRRTREEPSS